MLPHGSRCLIVSELLNAKSSFNLQRQHPPWIRRTLALSGSAGTGEPALLPGECHSPQVNGAGARINSVVQNFGICFRGKKKKCK